MCDKDCLARKMFVGMVFYMLKNKFRELKREYGDTAKVFGIDVHEGIRFLLTALKDACDLLLKEGDKK